jgi:hypothetical protein
LRVSWRRPWAGAWVERRRRKEEAKRERRRESMPAMILA